MYAENPKYILPTYFTINSILLRFLDEHKLMSQNIIHQPQNYQSTQWAQRTSFKHRQPHTKRSTTCTNNKTRHCRYHQEKNRIEMWNREQSCWLSEQGDKSIFVGYNLPSMSPLSVFYSVDFVQMRSEREVNIYYREGNQTSGALNAVIILHLLIQRQITS